ncbi:hypothetical protein, partial [Pseudomonas taetrolens]|uniref:hypothetical protein n=1 Tax=Pseudomonas taetrolens TaxID=47884 RepID=UPI003F9D8903
QTPCLLTQTGGLFLCREKGARCRAGDYGTARTFFESRKTPDRLMIVSSGKKVSAGARLFAMVSNTLRLSSKHTRSR